MALRIVSLNAWGGRVYAPLIRYLAEIDPDVLCLQEVTRTAGSKADWLVYRDRGLELPQRANLFDAIAAVLPGHDGFFCPTARGELSDGEDVVLSEFGLATFVRKSLPVIGQALDFVHGGFSADGWGAHPRARNAHCLRLMNYEDGFTITVAHMHGLRDIAGKEDTPARRAQAEALVRLVERVRHENERLVVCGDFNVLPGSETFDVLGKLGLTDLVTSRGFTDTRTSYYEKDNRFADYLLVTPEVKVLRFDVVDKQEVSDHRALLAEVG
ncbi:MULTISPECIES: endonuclease/exonuclease/phosphatase family protein [unclassified Sinorhizobium]|uniref:endonuclease/exonuclease/phosphatase family protein n=1 Tax=unclassified Sinorhizobium TaxID=2613772 RepID=UPI0024C34F7E|nr:MULTISPECIES: endonuclease/exonuclease/phosphatase family protein [unclassified Sinorhizobium]MDK1373557.1 endonuclease/exonuclease/phosphatase family protein [Sinorhizobium sp. 6-70]MDK1483074.1 endonuclease/exonuclease/phosphatase family protein [Sinorhizobium sp. 6-117]